MRFDTILIANRGEIAQRVLRTARTMGYRTVAVYSEADRDLPHVQEADMAICIGPAPSNQSYLNVDAIIAACKTTGAQAVHPGYGFLSENADFARTLKQHDITFIGPPPEAIEAMGNKAQSKRLMQEADVPCVPGYNGHQQDDQTLIGKAEAIGFPLMVKASAGGGGKGMRLVHDMDALPAAIQSARNEALNSFGSDELLLERAVMQPRHVEIQVFADEHGNVVHMGERDCSVQRRHQKVVEEAPSPAMTPELREQMGQAAINAARAIGYVGAGTVEFLLGQDGQFYFLEMNTRLQVEHPVTEEITGLDLVALQLSVAQGERLPVEQAQIGIHGHAIEVRLYAEDPYNQFLPQTGHIQLWQPPTALTGVRVDHNLRSSQSISPYYDPMIAKIIAHGATREEARRRLIRALESCVVMGTTTNRTFLIDCLRHEQFAAGEATTAFINDHIDLNPSAHTDNTMLYALCAVLFGHGRTQGTGWTPNWSSTNHQRLYRIDIDDAVQSVHVDATDASTYAANVNGATHHVRVLHCDEASWRVEIDGVQQSVTAIVDDDQLWISTDTLDIHARDILRQPVQVKEGADGKIKAPMTGKIIHVAVNVGDIIEEGQTLATLEAMKMEHNITSPIAGTIEEIFCTEGEQAEAKSTLVVIQPTQHEDS